MLANVAVAEFHRLRPQGSGALRKAAVDGPDLKEALDHGWDDRDACSFGEKHSASK